MLIYSFVKRRLSEYRALAAIKLAKNILLQIFAYQCLHSIFQSCNLSLCACNFSALRSFFKYLQNSSKFSRFSLCGLGNCFGL